MNIPWALKWAGSALLCAATIPFNTAYSSAGDGRHIAQHGGKQAAALACDSCHGSDGGGNEGAGFPRLAGLDAAYLQRQLHAFRDGTNRNAVMAGVAKALTEGEIKAVARYYAALAPVSRAQAPAGVSLVAGAALSEYGDWVGRGLPACNQCHGPGGQGVGESFPPLAGQPSSYIANRIAAWQSGQRSTDPLGLMRRVAERLTDAEVKSVAAYYAALPVTGPKAASPVSIDTATPKAHSGGAGGNVSVAQAGQGGTSGLFQPLGRNAYPQGPLGEKVREGEAIFRHTNDHPLAGKYVGNRQSCENCHLDAGRLANSAPMWASWVAYPAYRKKNGRVNTMADRIQGCFKYSMNAQRSKARKAPSADSDTIISLMSYFYWLATGAPSGDRNMAGRGYPRLAETEQGFDPKRGAAVYARNCALCHAEEGEGRMAHGVVVFPPLWGPESYNWGAGMHKVDAAAGYIKYNMPLGLADPVQAQGYLSDQEAWDVAAFMNAHPRPQDPRYNGSLEETAQRFHESRYDYYGKLRGPNGRLLGQDVP
jgi:thiosulfate dehydrogenase